MMAWTKPLIGDGPLNEEATYIHASAICKSGLRLTAPKYSSGTRPQAGQNACSNASAERIETKASQRPQYQTVVPGRGGRVLTQELLRLDIRVTLS
jgi:hypothetical protein